MKSMRAVKDRVYDKLSRLFSDSQSSHVTLDQESEARSYSKDGKTVSSIPSSILPSPSFGWFKPSTHNTKLKSTGSHSFKWRSKSFSLKDKPLDRYADSDNEYQTNEHARSHEDIGVPEKNHNHESFGSHLENVEPGSGTSTSSSSDVFEDAATPHSFKKSMARLTDESIFISPDLYDFFEASLPNIVKGCQWVLLYSTVRHGISLHTLVRKSAGVTGPCLLITGDKQGAVFGGLLDCPLKPTAKRKYQGTNQSFVFTTIYGEPRLFRPTGANRYFYLCLNDLLALGGGANFALCLNEDLLSGTSGPCETFGNSCLAHDQEFELKNVELWGFTHASPYIH
ncbi:Oxidation resistance protein [Handroanthus impetiginosus]|uniref:Oxidation resistance protein n=1 Tax=Handroanthus impetiginosus TaxID=429701 RepID=A0A2G9GVG7_9LAMI|nr:Oxidation resistance protein [Handroanthus impetiginosus]